MQDCTGRRFDGFTDEKHLRDDFGGILRIVLSFVSFIHSSVQVDVVENAKLENTIEVKL